MNTLSFTQSILPKQTSVRVLIVEDERIVAMDLQHRVERLGHCVVGTTGTGELAVQRAEVLRPDLVLMDIRLEGDMDGVTAAEQIRDVSDVPIIFLSAFSDSDTVRRATSTEPFGYVLKPVDDRDLEIAIGVALYRHQAEQRVRRVERWLSTTLTSIGDGVVATDLDGHVTLMNTMAQKLTGWEFEEACNHHIDEVVKLVNDSDQTPIENRTARVLDEGIVLGPAPETVLIRRNGGRLSIADSAAPIRDENGQITGTVLVFRDITQQKRMAEELRQSSKLEAVGRLAGGVAHEFNNLMAVVMGHSHLLLLDERLSENVRAKVSSIQRAGEKAVGLTRQLLTFGRKGAFQPVRLDLNSVIRETVSMLTRILGDHVTLTADLTANRTRITADASEIEQMLLILAANGRDAMPAGGTLTISTTAEESTVLLQVTDSGVGMTQDMLEHLFEPFFTTKDVGMGTGLGLAAVYGAVTHAGGNIDVESVVGKGTKFSIHFPRLKEPFNPTD